MRRLHFLLQSSQGRVGNSVVSGTLLYANLRSENLQEHERCRTVVAQPSRLVAERRRSPEKSIGSWKSGLVNHTFKGLQACMAWRMQIGVDMMLFDALRTVVEIE